mmetsp:Transcript_4660/g.11967  ORF Transcript_4660/g.11967 Transcript_4660/m.11967 type:complete len:371 (+) Transcript_4660:1848-2960(+)
MLFNAPTRLPNSCACVRANASAASSPRHSSCSAQTKRTSDRAPPSLARTSCASASIAAAVLCSARATSSAQPTRVASPRAVSSARVRAAAMLALSERRRKAVSRANVSDGSPTSARILMKRSASASIPASAPPSPELVSESESARSRSKSRAARICASKTESRSRPSSSLRLRGRPLAAEAGPMAGSPPSPETSSPSRSTTEWMCAAASSKRPAVIALLTMAADLASWLAAVTTLRVSCTRLCARSSSRTCTLMRCALPAVALTRLASSAARSHETSSSARQPRMPASRARRSPMSVSSAARRTANAASSRSSAASSAASSAVPRMLWSCAEPCCCARARAARSAEDRPLQSCPSRLGELQLRRPLRMRI